VDGVTSALGEVALLDPVLAGWGPPVCLAAIVLWLALRDGWQGPRQVART
jgi:hypothetical protein